MATDYDFAGARVKGRNPWAVLGLGLLTLGIYILYWWYQVNREVRDASRGQVPVDPWVSVIAVTIGALVVVPPIVSFHQTGRRVQALGRLAGASDTLNMWLYWALWLLTGWGGYIYLQWAQNRTWDAMQATGTPAGEPVHHAGLPGGEERHHRGPQDANGPFI
ncbi:MAG: DUF4234 domain-containing protein [Thermoleophilia bacterium]|nr:DUF4234 domain-containing protein [Thermoleophilia bacterium]